MRHHEEVEFPFMLGLTWTGFGSGHYLLGNLDTARDHCRKGLEIQTQSGSVEGLSLPHQILALAEYDSGLIGK